MELIWIAGVATAILIFFFFAKFSASVYTLDNSDLLRLTVMVIVMWGCAIWLSMGYYQVVPKYPAPKPPVDWMLLK